MMVRLARLANGYSLIELPNGNMAVSYAVAVVKDLGGGITDGIQDVYVRVFDPSTGLPVSDEVNLTNGVKPLDHIVATDTSGFIVNRQQRTSWSTLDSHVGFRTSGTDLIWRSEEDPTISLVLNETKPQMNDGSPGSVWLSNFSIRLSE